MPLQKIIGSNLLTTKNALDILTQDLDKERAHNRIIKLNAIFDVYISSPLGLEPKVNINWQ